MSLVQPIIVAKTGSHEETIMCAARASLGVYFRPNNIDIWVDNFSEWLAGSFTKSVRRVSLHTLSKIALHAMDENIPHEIHEIGDSAALALPPMAYDQYPKLVTKAQVSGTDFIRLGRFPAVTTQGGVKIMFLDSLSTGKASAQVAHGLWAIYHRNKSSLTWEDSSLPLELVSVSKAELKVASEQEKTVSIVDKGLTEIEPNTLTAVSYFR